MTELKHLNILLALSRYDHRTHKGVAQFAAKHNWHLNCEMAITGKPPSTWQGDGIITLLSEDQDIVNYVQNAGVPFVDISIIREDIVAPRVSADNLHIGHLAAQYYLDKGFRHFAFFSTTNDKVSRLRRDSYFHTAQKRALTTSDWTNWEKVHVTNVHKGLINGIKSTPQPLALFAARDIDASIALDACIQSGVDVPDQIAILGVDNNELITNSLRVPLSSVNHDVEALGYAGAQLLHKIIGTPNNQLQSLSPLLIPPKGITSRLSTDCLAVNNMIVRKALLLLNECFSKRNYSVELTAKACNVSRRHLDELFKKELGHSMHTELLNIRLRMAKKALSNSSYSIAKISADCGFTRVQYFNNTFRKKIGITPLSYRKNYQ